MAKGIDVQFVIMNWHYINEKIFLIREHVVFFSSSMIYSMIVLFINVILLFLFHVSLVG